MFIESLNLFRGKYVSLFGILLKWDLVVKEKFVKNWHYFGPFVYFAVLRTFTDLSTLYVALIVELR